LASRIWTAGLLLLGVLAGAGLSELAVRAIDAAPPAVIISRGRFRLSTNPRIAYEPVPDLNYTGASLDFYNYRGANNSLGYRGPQYPTAKPVGAFRILVLGDSIAEGIRIDDYADVFSALLESTLRARGWPVEVMNFAVSGYNTQQEVETLKQKGIAFKPDLVILAYCLNDRESPYYFLLTPLLEDARRAGLHGSAGASVEKALHCSALYRFLRYRVLRAVAADPAPNALYRGYDTGDTVPSSLEELARFGRQEGFQTLVLVFPRLDDLTFRHYPFWGEHAFIRNLAERDGFLVLDLLDAFRACARTSTRSLAQEYLHPTAEGHRCAAAALVESVESSVLSPAQGKVARTLIPAPVAGSPSKMRRPPPSQDAKAPSKPNP
jgi:lysophospholipase L1-like esterase